LRRAAAVGRLMLGELDAPLEVIRQGRTAELRAALDSARSASPHVARQVDYLESRASAC
jgi:hypothetical protein